MKKELFLVGIVVLGIIGLYFGYTSKVQYYNPSTGSLHNIDSYVYSMPKQPLSAKEKEGILYMREEEKLARDTYLYFYDKYKLPIFKNIAKSEQTHMDAVKALIDKYGLQDPAKNEVGEFTNPKLQALYDNLTAEGSKSLIAALEVGATIEEVDIEDLKKYIAETDNEDIKFVYENLMKGSRNHLRSFVSTLEAYNVTYVPKFLNQSEYNAIISTDIERG